MRTVSLYRIVDLFSFPERATFRTSSHQIENSLHGLTVLALLVCVGAGHDQVFASTTPVLTHENGSYTIFDSQREEHTFIPGNDGRLFARYPTVGTLTHLSGNQYQWIDASGLSHHFNGSRLAQSSARDGLQECSPTLPVPSDDDSQQPAGLPTQPSGDEQCDTASTGSHTFLPLSYTGPNIALDARPHTCNSFFVEYYGTRRGLEIEAGLNQHAPYSGMTPTLRTFPVIDFIDEQALYVVHSRDLGNRTFNAPSRPQALLNQLLDDGQDIQTRFVDVLQRDGSITASELDQSTTITLDQLRPIVMQLVIRDGIASAAHWQQIATAREQLMLRYSITLEIVLIP